MPAAPAAASAEEPFSEIPKPSTPLADSSRLCRGGAQLEDVGCCRPMTTGDAEALRCRQAHTTCKATYYLPSTPSTPCLLPTTYYVRLTSSDCLTLIYYLRLATYHLLLRTCDLLLACYLLATCLPLTSYELLIASTVYYVLPT